MQYKNAINNFMNNMFNYTNSFHLIRILGIIFSFFLVIYSQAMENIDNLSCINSYSKISHELTSFQKKNIAVLATNLAWNDSPGHGFLRIQRSEFADSIYDEFLNEYNSQSGNVEIIRLRPKTANELSFQIESLARQVEFKNQIIYIDAPFYAPEGSPWYEAWIKGYNRWNGMDALNQKFLFVLFVVPSNISLLDFNNSAVDVFSKRSFSITIDDTL